MSHQLDTYLENAVLSPTGQFSIHVPNPYRLRTLNNNSQVQYMLLITMIKNGHENEMSFLLCGIRMCNYNQFISKLSNSNMDMSVWPQLLQWSLEKAV